MILRYNGTTGAFIDVVATALNFPQYLALAPTVAATVSEPGALALLAVGLGGLALVCRRWKRPRKVYGDPRGLWPIGV